jgi:cell volume regulation protein A
MLSVEIVFLLFASIVFFGFILQSFFFKLKISPAFPLMLVGLLIGPVLHLIQAGQGSTVSALVPYITALAVSFILFDVGMNMNIRKLGSVLARANAFTFTTALVTAFALFLVAYFVFHWSAFASLIFGFALAGPSAIISPTLLRVIGIIPDKLKSTLLYESVATDTLQLIVPLILIGLIVTPLSVTASGIADAIFTIIIGAVLLGIILAIAWLYLLNRYQRYSERYSWTLTISMVVAAYAISEILGISGVITVFVFGLAFSNIGSVIHSGRGWRKYVRYQGRLFDHIKRYQSEIVFFTSTFFFVYIGILFQITTVTIFLVGLAIALSLVILMIRMLFVGMIGKYTKIKGVQSRKMSLIASFNTSRGLSSAIIATVPISLGIIIPNFLDEMFLIILITNLISTVGIFILTKRMKMLPPPPIAERKAAAAK